MIGAAKETFKDTDIEFSGDDMITMIQAHEVEKYFASFGPEKWLSTSIVNPLISLFDWGPETLVLHSSRMEVGNTGNVRAWKIPPYCRYIILPSCHDNHWTLFHIDLHERITRRYDSLGTDFPQVLKDALQHGVREYDENNPTNLAWKFCAGVSSDFSGTET